MLGSVGSGSVLERDGAGYRLNASSASQIGLEASLVDRHPCRGGFRALLSVPLFGVVNRPDGWRSYMSAVQPRADLGRDVYPELAEADRGSHAAVDAETVRSAP